MKILTPLLFAALMLTACSPGSLTGETCHYGYQAEPKCSRGQFADSCVDSEGNRRYSGKCVGVPDHPDAGDAGD